jgi:hypothetical protein
MRKQTQVPKSPTELRNQLLQQANTVTELFKGTEYADDFVDEIAPTTRSEVAPPLKPPKDPQIWFSLYQQLSEMEYGEREDDWITLRKGGYETSRELIDSKGKVIDSL